MPRAWDIPLVGMIPDPFDIDTVAEIPIIGDLYGAGNAIIDFYESDCRPSWDVYIRTLFPAFGTLVIAFFGFGLNDILRGYFRPGGVRGFGFLNRGRRVKPGKPRTKLGRFLGKIKIPEIGNEMGKKLPGAKFFYGLPVGNKMNWFWSLTDVFAQFGYYWLIADITEDFIVHWTSALYRSEDCAHPQDKHCTYKTTWGGYGPDKWRPIPYALVPEESDPGCPGWFPVTIPHPGTPRFAFSVEGVPYSIPHATGYQLGVRDFYNTDLFYATSPTVEVTEDGPTENRTFAQLPGPGYYQPVIKPTGGYFMIQDGDLLLDISYPPAGPPD